MRVVAGLILLMAAAVPVRAENGSCRARTREVERDLALNADRLSAADRVAAEQRLRRAGNLCLRESGRAGHDLELLQRDIMRQATRPRDLPGQRPAIPSPGR